MYYSAIDILAILVLLIENQGILTKRGSKFKQPALRAYKSFLISALAYFVTDAAWGIAEHLKNSPLALFSVTSVYFVAMALSVTCWIGFILSCLDEGAKLKKALIWTGRVFAAGVAVLVVVNIFTPVMFTVDENCAYKALSGRYIILLIQIIVLLFLSCYAFFVIFKRKTGETKKYNNLALFGVIMASFLIAQFYFPFLPLYATAYLLGICLLHTYVINDEKDIFEKEMEEAKKISALRQSFNSLFDNMPVNAYSKDIETGEYLACNRSFAKYVHLNSPEEIIGQTDYELFDSKTAAHFIEVDKMAAESNKPYTIFEDVFDTDGNPRQFQTTKLTFIDESGRHCILGMSMDITETIKAKKENEATKAAYLEALNSSAVYENIVGILSKDYFDIYYINIETNNYIEYGSKNNDENAPKEKRGDDFFKSIKTDAPNLIYEEDLPKILELLEKETLLREIEEQGIFIYYYRLMIDGKPNYVCLKATRVEGDSNYIIIGVSNVDSQMKNRIDIENAKKEKMAYERLSAFSRNIIALYMVDTENDEYVCYSSTEDFDELGISESGGNFFDETYQNSLNAVFEDDREMFHHTFTKKNILNSINLDGVFVMDYRIVIGGEPKYVRLKATEFEENGKVSLVIGIEDVDSYVRREQQQASELSRARELATKDALTGVKNSYAFVREKEHLKDLIDKGEISELAVVICDINGLKTVNDTKGHQIGDELIKKACATICNIFKHSGVFRIGGDEFAVICRGQDYENIGKLLEEMDSANISNNGVEIAYGMAKYSSSTTIDEVIHNADSRMYDYKSALKTNKGAVLGSITPEQPTLYEFPEDLKKAYESSPLSFVYYQNINDRAVPVLFSKGFCRNVGIARENIAQWLSNDMFERMHPDDVGIVAQISDDFLHQTAP
ncbi:MAG: diguanylate cyclase [Eubacterium sp.]|nr:diguanylate cyclase [Eubacterium sp.]